MSSINKSACALAVFAVAALAGPAFAGKPMNVLEKRAAAQAKAQEMQQAANQSATASDGTDTAVVPEDLHNYMRVERDAKGNIVRVIEVDGPNAPVSKKPEATNE